MDLEYTHHRWRTPQALQNRSFLQGMMLSPRISLFSLEFHTYDHPRSTVLVGSSVLISLAIFRIILYLAFSFVDKLLNGGLIYEFFPDNDWVKISNKAPNDLSLLYPEIHVLKRFEWCRESDIPSTSRWRCLCSISRRPWVWTSSYEVDMYVYLRTYSRNAWYSREPFFLGRVRFMPIIRVGFPVIVD